MTRLLLDTNQLLRVADRPDELSTSAVRSLADASALYVPVVAAWEVEIKRRLVGADGRPKLPVEGTTASLVRYVVERGARLLPLGLEHVTVELKTPCPNRDPFDQVLLQQCQVENLALLTSDTKLRGHPLVMYVG